jgi:hypothetical protein
VKIKPNTLTVAKLQEITDWIKQSHIIEPVTIQSTAKAKQMNAEEDALIAGLKHHHWKKGDQYYIIQHQLKTPARYHPRKKINPQIQGKKQYLPDPQIEYLPIKKMLKMYPRKLTGVKGKVGYKPL